MSVLNVWEPVSYDFLKGHPVNCVLEIYLTSMSSDNIYKQVLHIDIKKLNSVKTKLIFLMLFFRWSNFLIPLQMQSHWLICSSVQLTTITRSVLSTLIKFVASATTRSLKNLLTTQDMWNVLSTVSSISSIESYCTTVHSKSWQPSTNWSHW